MTPQSPTDDDHYDDTIDEAGETGDEPSSMNHMLAALQSQEQKHAQVTRSLKSKIATLQQQLAERDEELAECHAKLSGQPPSAPTPQASQPDNSADDAVPSPAPSVANAATVAAAEARVRELESELEAVRAQKRELMELNHQDKTTSVLLAQELQVQSHLVQEKSVEMAALRTSMQELQIKFDMEVDSFAAERRQFQQKIAHLQKTLQNEEQANLTTANESHQLSANVLQLTQENVALGEQLRVQEAKIREVLDAFQTRERELAHLREQHALLVNQLAESANIQQENTMEMKKSSEQLRAMAEKVFALLAQIQKMEAFRLKALEEQRQLNSQIVQLNNTIEERQELLTHEQKQRVKLEKDLSFVQKSLEDQRLLVLDLRRKLAAEEGKTRQLQVALKNKVEECDELHQKHSQLSLQARTTQAVADKQRAATAAMEERLRHSAHTIITLQSRTETLQQALAKASIQSQGPTHEDEFRGTREPLQARRSISSGGQGSARAKDRPPSSLTRHTGQNPVDNARVAEMLRAFRIDETTALAMAKQPMTLLVKVADIYDHLQSQLRLQNQPNSTQAGLSNDVDAVVQKNQELTLKHQKSEQARIRMLQSMTAVVQKVQNVLVLSAEPPVKSSFFLSGGDGSADGAASPPPAVPQPLTGTSLVGDEELNNFFRSITLTEHNLGDEGAKLVADAVRTSHNVQSIDVSRNHIRSEGLASLVQALVVDSCSVQNVDVSMNDVNAEGLLTLCTVLQRMQNVVRTATFLSSLPAAALSNTGELAKFGSDEADGSSASLAGKIRPIIEIGTNTKTLYIDLSHNLFDERVMARMVNLMQADLNDPIVRQIIIQARKAAVTAQTKTEKMSDPVDSLMATQQKRAAPEMRRSGQSSINPGSSSNLHASASTSSLGRSSSRGRLGSSGGLESPAAGASRARHSSAGMTRSSSNSTLAYGQSPKAANTRYDDHRSESRGKSTDKSRRTVDAYGSTPGAGSGSHNRTPTAANSKPKNPLLASASRSSAANESGDFTSMFRGTSASKNLSTDDLVRAAMSGADAYVSRSGMNASPTGGH
jgi:hypothetical protein